MDRFPLMLVRFPARTSDAAQLQDGRYDTTVVHSEDEIQAGWYETAALARQAHDEDEAAIEAAGMKAADVSDDELPATRAELEQKATELGVTFDGRTSDKTLARKIGEAIKA